MPKLDTFGRGEIVSEFEVAAFDNQDGVIWPEPVETSYGYHIGQTIEHNPADVESIKADYIEFAKANYANELIFSLIENAQIQKAESFADLKINTDPNASIVIE